MNMGLNLEMNLQKQMVFILLCLYLICAKYEFETFGATRDKIRLMAFYLNPDIMVFILQTWLPTNDETGIIVNDL